MTNCVFRSSFPPPSSCTAILPPAAAAAARRRSSSDTQGNIARRPPSFLRYSAVTPPCRAPIVRPIDRTSGRPTARPCVCASPLSDPPSTTPSPSLACGSPRPSAGNFTRAKRAPPAGPAAVGHDWQSHTACGGPAVNPYRLAPAAWLGLTTDHFSPSLSVSHGGVNAAKGARNTTTKPYETAARLVRPPSGGGGSRCQGHAGLPRRPAQIRRL